MEIGILGAGWLGTVLAEKGIENNHNVVVSSTNKKKLEIFKNNGYPKIQAMPGYFPQDMIPDEVKIGAHISLQYRKSTTAKHIEDLKRVTGINLHKWVCFSS